MSARNAYNWPRLYRQAQDYIREGGTATWRALSIELKVPENTLISGFRREFDVTRNKLGEILNMPLPSSSLGPEDNSLPPQYNNISPKEVTEILKGKPRSLTDLADALDRGRTAVSGALDAMITDGYEFTREENRIYVDYKPAPAIPTLWDQPKQRIRFGVYSDTHFGSKHAQVSALTRFIRLAVEEYDVRNFLHVGDVTAGVGVYRGQSNDLYAHSAEDQVEATVNSIPQFDGVEHILLAGNHDYSFMKQNGFNIVKTICSRRADFTYAGFDYAEIPLTQDAEGQVTASAVLWHPSGGVPYALSYRGQKMAAEVSRQELAEIVMDRKLAPTVRFIFWGHLHVSDIFPHGPIWVIGPGCFEGKNGYLKQKGLTPVIQGMVIEADVTDRGLIAGVHIHPYPFLEAEDDYKAGWVPEMARESQLIEPVFGVQEEQ